MKYAITILSTLLIVALAYILYSKKEKDNSSWEVNQALKNEIRSVNTKIDSLQRTLGKVTHDTVFNSSVRHITNNFNSIYENIDTSESFDSLIDYLIARHSETKVERDY